MIIKSMSRKDASFGQLVSYFHKEAEKDTPTLTHNLYCQPDDQEAVVRAMEDNARHLKKRHGGVVLYHEVIVLEQTDQIPKDRQNEILLDLAEKYLASRAPRQLAYGRIHDDRKHQHIHLCISANAPTQSKRERLSKADFGNVQRDLEVYKIETYPELGSERYYEKSEGREKVTSREGEFTRRTGRQTQKHRIHETVQNCLKSAMSEAELKSQLQAQGLELYQRGKTWGVAFTETGRKYRMKTLGLDRMLDEARAGFQGLEKRMEQLKSSRPDREKARGRSETNRS